MKIDVENWEEWLAHPLTEAMFEMCRRNAVKPREQWLRVSFDSGKCDPITLAEMRARAAAFQELSELTRETLEEELE